MKWLVPHFRRIAGLDEEDHHDLFELGRKPSRIRVKVAIGAATVAGLAVIVLSIATSLISSSGSQVELPVDLTATPVDVSQHELPPLGSVLIHVVGEVNNPGIYELESGSRVIDAVMAAGGMSAGASECGVNLAREVNDGEQISIPSQQQGCSSGTGSSANTVISLNQATVEQFDSLPGIGPTLAERIVQWRESNSGFSSVDQLNEVSGIGDKLFAGLKDLVSL